MGNKRRADRQRATAEAAEGDKVRAANAARRLVSCPSCGMIFYRDMCEGTRIPGHYRRFNGTSKVEDCAGGGKHFHRAPND